MTTIKPATHTLNKEQVRIYEVWDGDRFIAAIYPTERGVKIVSKYIENREDLLQVEPLEPPAILVNILREK